MEHIRLILMSRTQPMFICMAGGKWPLRPVCKLDHTPDAVQNRSALLSLTAPYFSPNQINIKTFSWDSNGNKNSVSYACLLSCQTAKLNPSCLLV